MYNDIGFLLMHIDASKGLEYTQKSLNFLRSNRQYYSLCEFVENEADLFYNLALLSEKLNDVDIAIEYMDDSVENRIFLLNNGVADQSFQLVLSYLSLGRWLTYCKYNFSEGRRYYRKIFEIIPLLSLNVNVCFIVYFIYECLVENLQNEIKNIEKNLSSIKDKNKIAELNILKENLLDEVDNYKHLLKTDDGYQNYIDWKENGGEIKQMLFK